jgi:hypothetical protein
MAAGAAPPALLEDDEFQFAHFSVDGVVREYCQKKINVASCTIPFVSAVLVGFFLADCALALQCAQTSRPTYAKHFCATNVFSKAAQMPTLTIIPTCANIFISNSAARWCASTGPTGAAKKPTARAKTSTSMICPRWSCANSTMTMVHVVFWIILARILLLEPFVVDLSAQARAAKPMMIAPICTSRTRKYKKSAIGMPKGFANTVRFQAFDSCVYLCLFSLSPFIWRITWDCFTFKRTGPFCRNRHVRNKLACSNYLVGFCPLGPDCPLGQYASIIELA